MYKLGEHYILVDMPEIRRRLYSNLVIGDLAVEDLTNNRIVVVGTGGLLEDDANLTWNGSTLGVNGDVLLQDGKKLLLGTGSDGAIYSSGDDLYVDNTTQDKDIIFRINDAGATLQAMRIDGSTGGKVGMGIATPSTRLHLYHATENSVLTVESGDAYATIDWIDNSGTGQTQWSGANDWFLFNDDILLNTSEKLYFRDTAIGIYSQADSYLDIFADGGIRIGDSSAGAPTNFMNIAPDGIATWAGTGRVTVDKYITAAGVKAPGAKPATFIQHGLAGAWQFANAIEANQQSVSGTMKLPTQMDKTAVPIFKVGWSANGVSPGGCEWQLEYLYLSPNENTTAAAQETLTATGTASGTTDGLIITAFSGMDLPDAADQAMFFEITRLSADAADTIADTTELHGMLFTHTQDKRGTPL